jgi:hypothetical protein
VAAAQINNTASIKQTVTSYKKKPMCELQGLTRRFVLDFLGNWKACKHVYAEFGISLTSHPVFRNKILSYITSFPAENVKM